MSGKAPPGAPIVGPRLRLRLLERADLPSLHEWRSNPEVERFWGRAPAEDEDLWAEAASPGCGVTYPHVVEEAGHGLGRIAYFHACDRLIKMDYGRIVQMSDHQGGRTPALVAEDGSVLAAAGTSGDDEAVVEIDRRRREEQ